MTSHTAQSTSIVLSSTISFSSECSTTTTSPSNGGGGGGGTGNTALNKAELVWGTYVSPVVCLFGIACNALNLLILTRRNMSGSPYTYLLGLAVTDIAVLSLSLVENTLSKPLGHGIYFWQLYEVFIFHPIANVFSNSSVWITVLLTIERYISVRYPLKAKKWCTRCLARRSIVLTVLISVIINIPRFLVSEISPCNSPCIPSINQSLHHLPLHSTSINNNSLSAVAPSVDLVELKSDIQLAPYPTSSPVEDFWEDPFMNSSDFLGTIAEVADQTLIRSNAKTNIICYETRSTKFEKSDYFVAWTWFYISIIHFIPCCLVLYLNVSLITIVYQANRRRISLRGSPCWAGTYSGYESAAGGCYSKEQIRLTITCISIICLFLVCIVPSAFSNKAVAKALFRPRQNMDEFTKDSFYRLLRVITNLLVYCNLSMNFILYCVFNHKFLYTLRRLCHTYLLRALHPHIQQDSGQSGGGNSSGGGGGGGGSGGASGGATVNEKGRFRRISSMTSGAGGLLLQMPHQQPNGEGSNLHKGERDNEKLEDNFSYKANKHSMPTKCSVTIVKKYSAKRDYRPKLSLTTQGQVSFHRTIKPSVDHSVNDDQQYMLRIVGFTSEDINFNSHDRELSSKAYQARPALLCYCRTSPDKTIRREIADRLESERGTTKHIAGEQRVGVFEEDTGKEDEAFVKTKKDLSRNVSTVQ